MNEGAVQPLHVEVVRERQQDLVADDGEGQEQHGARGHGQGEGAQEQPATEDRVSPPSGTARPRKPFTTSQNSSMFI